MEAGVPTAMATPSGRKRKRHHSTNTPVPDQSLQPNSGAREDVTMQSNQQTPVPEHPEEDDYARNFNGWEGDDYGHGWEDEGNTDYWHREEEDIDEGATVGCVEGLVEPEMVDGYIHGEENRKFRSQVWNEFSKVRVGGIVTKGQCIHCNTEISAKRGAGTSAMSTHLKRCQIRRQVTNMSHQLRSVMMSPEGVALDKWRFSQDTSRRELTRMIALHGLPLSVVDYPTASCEEVVQSS